MSTWKTHVVLLLSLCLLGPARAAADEGTVARTLSSSQMEELRSIPPEGSGRGGPSVEVTTGRPGTEVLVEVSGPERLRVDSERSAAARRRWPWIGTLAATGGALVVTSVLGGLALDRAQQFNGAVEAGAPTEDLLDLRGAARQLAFSTDLMLGTTALLGIVTVVLRFGVGTSRAPEPVDLERAYQLPDGRSAR